MCNYNGVRTLLENCCGHSNLELTKPIIDTRFLPFFLYFVRIRIRVNLVLSDDAVDDVAIAFAKAAQGPRLSFERHSLFTIFTLCCCSVPNHS